jgi:histone H1/5
MPIIKSAKKRVRVSQKAAVRNSKAKRSLKAALKDFHKTVTGGNKKATVAAHGKSQSELDKAAKKGLLHKNKVARQKRKLAATAKKAAGVTKTAPVKSASPAPVVKKAPVAKKPAAKAAPKKAAAPKAAAPKKATVKKAAAPKKPAAKK